MKKLKLLLLSILVIIPVTVNAASGTITVTGPNQVVVGNNVTYTVTVSSGVALGYWDMLLNYNSSMLQLVSTTNDMGGTRMMDTGDSKAKMAYYTYTFKALKSGNTTVSVGSYDIVDYDENSISISTSSKTTKIITQAELEASYSKDNDLKSLSVDGYDITPEFSKDVTEYTVIVPENTKKITINAVKNDSKASVSGTGEVDVTDGINKFNIVVSAENGSEKTYTINVEVKDTNPINVKIDGEDYIVVKIRENLKAPTAYNEKNITIDGIEVPAYYSDITGYTLVGLKNSNGKISLFIYNNGSYSRYIELKSGNITIIPQELKGTLKNYEKGSVKIQNEEIECLSIKPNSRFKVISGMNVETKETGLYIYDTKDKALMRYDEELLNTLNDKNMMLTYASLLFGGIAFISIVITLSLSKKKKVVKIEKTSNENKEIDISKKKSKIKKETKVEEDIKENNNEIVETSSNEEVYDIFEDEHKKKNRK